MGTQFGYPVCKLSVFQFIKNITCDDVSSFGWTCMHGYRQFGPQERKVQKEDYSSRDDGVSTILQFDRSSIQPSFALETTMNNVFLQQRDLFNIVSHFPLNNCTSFCSLYHYYIDPFRGACRCSIQAELRPSSRVFVKLTLYIIIRGLFG